ncbi:hypothetical protein JHK87_032382 [Glycine soja]|nr:hypothetical protein JHK87_032382 [Glycine soja]
MYRGVPVACRTRSKRGRVVGSGLIMGQKKKKVHDHEPVSLKRVRVSERGFDCSGGHAGDPIVIGDSGDDVSEAEEGLRHTEKRFLVEKEWKSEEGKRCSVFVDKVDNFGNDDYACVPENRVILPDDSYGDNQSEKEHCADKSGSDDSFLCLTESEDGATSDEDFQVDYDENDCCSSSEDSDSSSYDDDERGGYSKTVKERVRKVESETESSGVCKRKGGRKDNEEGEQWIGADCASATSSKSEIYKQEARNAAQKHESKRVESANVDAEVFGDHWKSSGCSMPSEAEALEHRKKRDTGHQNDSNQLEEKDDDFGQGQTKPLASRETIPLDWNFMKKEPIENLEFEKELDILWGEMDMLLRGEEIGSQVDNIGTNEARENEENSASQCKHDTIFNEEIGIYCRWCGWIATEIKYITPPFVDSERCCRRVSSGGGNTSQFDGDLFNDPGDDSEAVWSHNEGTVWDLIPDIKQSLYPHQQEGFEFIWTNLAGTTDLAKLKRVDPCSEGGCIVSHAPGTGKTRLTMVFLQTYLQSFPKCLPIIIAPANILLTWEDELRKWNIGIPFHNLNNSELSGKEKLINEVDWSGNQKQNKDAIRMVKLCSWYKEKSILLISYNLYEKLAGSTAEGDGKKEKKNNKMKKKKKRARPREYIESGMGKVLRDYPELKKFCQSRQMQERKDVSWDWEPVSSGNTADEKIKQLKLLMNPFVHVHKGSILQKNLPGLRDCVLVLKPDILQQETLESIEYSQSALNFEHKLALVSVHPSLFLNCSLSKKEESVVDKGKLEKLRLNPYGGVKTKFLFEFIRLCDAVDEKVLIFSQFIDTLCLIKDQLESAFNWSVGTEVLYMYGKLDHKQKQSLIRSFNDSNSQAKVLLASIKASSEGINLIGASRVVLLDVVWNPSVERQAICRAYRLGQKRVVFTYHLLAQGTPECTKYCKQAEKNRLSELVFSNRNAESHKLKSSGVMLEDIEDRVLDLMVQHKKLKDMFGECLVQPKERYLETLGP